MEKKRSTSLGERGGRGTVPPDAQHGVALLEAGKKCRGSAASSPVKLGWKKTLRRNEIVGTDSDDVPVWELASLLFVKISSRFELCVKHQQMQHVFFNPL